VPETSLAGLYALEERVFREVGLRPPKEVRWDLLCQTFVLTLLLLFSVCFGGLALVVAMSREVTLEVTSGEVAWEVTSKTPGGVDSILPEVRWLFCALPAIVCFVAFVVLLRRIITAWRRRNRPAASA